MFEIALIIAVVTALMQLIKQLEINNKYLLVISLLLGLIVGIFYVEGTIQEQVMYGLMIGLAAAGLFEQSKIVKKK